MNKISLISLALSFLFTSGFMCLNASDGEGDTTQTTEQTNDDTPKESETKETNNDEEKGKKDTKKKTKKKRTRRGSRRGGHRVSVRASKNKHGDAITNKLNAEIVANINSKNTQN